MFQDTESINHYSIFEKASQYELIDVVPFNSKN